MVAERAAPVAQDGRVVLDVSVFFFLVSYSAQGIA